MIGVFALCLLIGSLCDWIGGKTSVTLAVIAGTLLTGLLIKGFIHAAGDSLQPRPPPVCKQLRTC
jgi:hypothetical protein